MSKDKEARDLILANMLVNPNIWIGEMLDDKAMRTHQEWKKKKQSLTYQFKSDINELNDDFNSNFIVEDGQHPRILKLYNMKRISLETLVIVIDIVGCMGYWNKNISDKIVWPHINTLVSKYRPFLEYDKVKMKQILVDKYNVKH
jgi:hypothetical protein